MSVTHAIYQRRGYLSKQGYAQIDAVLRECAVLYNAALEAWRESYSRHFGWAHAKDGQTGEMRKSRDGTRYLWNEVREGRPDAKGSTLYDQTKEFTGIRADDAFWNGLDVGVGRGVLRRLDRAKNAFFRRLKEGEKPGYPRFKSGRRWRTIDLSAVRPGMVKGRRVKVKGLPPIKFEGDPLPPSERLKSLRITRVGRRVTLSLGYEVDKEPLPLSTTCVGIDFGVTDRMVFSNGQVMMAGGDIPAAGPDPAEILTSRTPIQKITTERVAPDVTESPEALRPKTGSAGVAPDVTESPSIHPRRMERRRVAPDVVESRTARDLDLYRKQQRLSRAKLHSGEYRRRAKILANAHSRRAVSNRNKCHRITTAIVREYGHIGIEALAIKNMTGSAAGTVEEPGRNVAAKSGLNREILAQTWGIIRQQLTYKAEWAGRRLVAVDPKNTSRTCSRCGTIDSESRNGKDFQCRHCRFEDDADHNAAVNILRLSLAGGNSPPQAREPA